MCVVFKLAILEAIDGLFNKTILQVQYYRHLWDKAQSDYKDHDLKAVTWNNIRKSLNNQVCAKLYMQFLRFFPQIWFICERSAETKQCKSFCFFGFVSFSAPYM